MALSLLAEAWKWIAELCGESEVARLFRDNLACVFSGEDVLRGDSALRKPSRRRRQKTSFSSVCQGAELSAEGLAMLEKTAIIKNPLGIHARPAALLVQAAAQFKADIYFSKGDLEGINSKSIMGVMMLAAEQGAQVTVRAEGEDAEAAVKALVALLESSFEGPS